MPASSGSCRMPAGNRQTTSGALRTNDMWSKAIGQKHNNGFGQNDVDDDGPHKRRKVPKAVEGSEEYERVRAILRSSKASRDGTVQDDGRGRWKGKARLKGLFVAPVLPSSATSNGGRDSGDSGEDSWSDTDEDAEEDDDEDDDDEEDDEKESGDRKEGVGSGEGATSSSTKTTTREEAVQMYNVELKLLQREQDKYKLWCKKTGKKEAKKAKKKEKKAKKKEKKRAKKKAKKKRKRSTKSRSSSDSDSSSDSEKEDDEGTDAKRKKRKTEK